MKQFLAFVALIFMCNSAFSFSQEIGPNVSPSYDCEKASTETEISICENKYLSALDIVLAIHYREALKGKSSQDVRFTQREWLRNRDKCAKGKSFGFFYTALHTCYADRINELKADHELKLTPEIYKEIATKLYLPLLEDSSSAGTKFVYYKNFNNFLYGLEESLCGFIPEWIHSETSYMLVTRYFGSSVCGGMSYAARATVTYCKTSNGNFVAGEIWNCHREDDYLDILQNQFASNSYSEFSEKLKPYQPDSWGDLKTGDNLLIKFLYSNPIHTIASKVMFSEKFLNIYQSNRNVFHKLIDYENKDYSQMLLGMQCAYDMIYSTENWKSIFEDDPPSSQAVTQGRYWYGEQFNGCNSYDLRIENELYTQKQLYVLFWKFFHDNGSTEFAKNILDQELETLANESTTFN